MSKIYLRTLVLCLVLGIFLICTSANKIDSTVVSKTDSAVVSKADSASSINNSDWSAEKMLLAELKLEEDVGDGEIIQLLDVPAKRILATALIRYKKISAAAPKLMDIFNSNDTTIPGKLCAAEALCDFGKKDWMQPIKVLLANKKHEAFIPLKLDVAGLLARAGDYSQFEIVANQIDNSKCSVRYVAIEALGNFQHETEAVTDSAADLLTFVAVSDSVPWLREFAIGKLEQIAARKPAIASKVIEALEANKDSADKNLRVISRVKLTYYGR